MINSACAEISELKHRADLSLWPDKRRRKRCTKSEG